MSTLSAILLDERFLPTFAVTERVGERPQIVRAGKPLSYGVNGCVLAIYDERGLPWVTHDEGGRLRSLVARTSRFCGFPLCSGAPVPHSGDGGFFLREVLPAHWPKQKK